MEIFPAIDIRGGQVVRLTQGDFDRMEVYSENPVEIAEQFKVAGAKNLHVVDLDGAKNGELSNFDAVKNIVDSGGLFVEIGGGIRDEERINRYLELGVGRVILGTIVVDDFDFTCKMIEKYGDKIALGIDALDGKVAVRGWLDRTDIDAEDLCAMLAEKGAKTIIYTDISKDGAMSGTNTEAYSRLQKNIKCNIIASGGISSTQELLQLKEMGVHGAILGKSLYTGVINLKEVMKNC